jgi:hypothetical protein
MARRCQCEAARLRSLAPRVISSLLGAAKRCGSSRRPSGRSPQLAPPSHSFGLRSAGRTPTAPTGSLPGDRLSHKPHPGRCGGPARGFELAGLDRCPPLAALALPGDRARHACVEVAVRVPVESAHLGGGRPGRGRPNRPGPSPSGSRSPSSGPSSRASGRGQRANKKRQPGRSKARWVTPAGGHAGQRRRPVMRWDQPCCAGPPVGAGIPLHRSPPPRSGGPGSARAHAAARPPRS